MSWKRGLKIGGLIVLGLLLIPIAYLLIAKPWQPKLEMADAGSAGRRVTGDGLLANYYPGKGAGPRPAILFLGGSEGGLSDRGGVFSETLAARGYATLQMSYFRGPGQPKRLENLPLENFDTALAWLAKQPGVDKSRMAVIGASKGAEAALLIATRHPELKAVVAAMPSNVVWSGVDWNFGTVGSSWSVKGKPLAYLPLGKFNWSRMRREGLISMYGLAALPRHLDAVIPVERAAAPLLLVCGDVDNLWPSCPMARALKARADKAGRPAVTLLAYPKAGHGVFGMPRDPKDPKFDNLAMLGGTAAANNAARKDGWPKTLAFLDAALK